MTIHKLIIDDKKVETACGMKVAVFYPIVDEIMTKDGKTVQTTFDSKIVTCCKCNHAESYVTLDTQLRIITPIMANSK